MTLAVAVESSWKKEREICYSRAMSCHRSRIGRELNHQGSVAYFSLPIATTCRRYRVQFNPLVSYFVLYSDNMSLQ